VVALELRVSPTTTAADVWLNRLHAFHHNKQESRYARNYWGIENILEASADYCDELKTCSREAGKSDAEEEFARLELEFRELVDPRTDLHAVRRREPLADPKAELDYWTAQTSVAAPHERLASIPRMPPGEAVGHYEPQQGYCGSSYPVHS
jgi:hypothetical protein